MKWVRGATIGRGSSGTVSLAIVPPRRGEPSLIAVKSAPFARSSLLQREKCILDDLHGCPEIVRCFGDDLTTEDGAELYNLFLEYVPGGTLSDLIRRSGGGLPPADVRRYTRSLLRGLRYVHARGYVHCDVKPQNVLVMSGGGGGGRVKIVDFGLAKKAGDTTDGVAHRCIRGTPLYMAPESVVSGEYEAPADVWSLGCVVTELASGMPPWRSSRDGDAWPLVMRIGFGDDLPEIPAELPEDGKDFLRRCFARDPDKRWSAEMLLDHPFLAAKAEEVIPPPPPLSDRSSTECIVTAGSSPRGIFDFSDRMSIESSFPSTCSTSTASLPVDHNGGGPVGRIRHLATGQPPDRFLDDGWISVRGADSTSTSEALMGGDDQCWEDNPWGWGDGRSEIPASTSSDDAIQLVLPKAGGCESRDCSLCSHCRMSRPCLHCLKAETCSDSPPSNKPEYY